MTDLTKAREALTLAASALDPRASNIAEIRKAVNEALALPQSAEETTKETCASCGADMAVRCEYCRAAPPSPAMDPVTWRCFHCSEVFTDKEAAREHFGFITLLEPGCIDPMRGDEKALRRREIESERLFRTVCAERDKLFGELKQARALLASPVLGIQANP